MAFGHSRTQSPTQGGQFLGRIQFDARVGFWKIVKRIQQSDGGWDDDTSEPFRNPTFLLDIGTLEVGYIKFASPPAFLVVPFGQEIPPRPADRVTDAEGKSRSAYLPGFRVKVYNPKLFGDADPYYFANNSKTVLEPMDALHTLAIQAPEAQGRKGPSCQGNRHHSLSRSMGHVVATPTMRQCLRLPAGAIDLKPLVHGLWRPLAPRLFQGQRRRMAQATERLGRKPRHSPRQPMKTGTLQLIMRLRIGCPAAVTT